MVQAEEDRCAFARAVKLDQLPEGAGAIEGPLVDRPDRPEEIVESRVLRRTVSMGERVSPDVEVEIEGRIVLPARLREVEWSVHDPLAEPWYGLHRTGHRGTQTIRVRTAVEQEQHRHGRALTRLISPPEAEVLSAQRLGPTARSILRHGLSSW